MLKKRVDSTLEAIEVFTDQPIELESLIVKILLGSELVKD